MRTSGISSGVRGLLPKSTGGKIGLGLGVGWAGMSTYAAKKRYFPDNYSDMSVSRQRSWALHHPGQVGKAMVDPRIWW